MFTGINTNFTEFSKLDEFTRLTSQIQKPLLTQITNPPSISYSAEKKVLFTIATKYIYRFELKRLCDDYTYEVYANDFLSEELYSTLEDLYTTRYAYEVEKIRESAKEPIREYVNNNTTQIPIQEIVDLAAIQYVLMNPQDSPNSFQNPFDIKQDDLDFIRSLIEHTINKSIPNKYALIYISNNPYEKKPIDLMIDNILFDIQFESPQEHISDQQWNQIISQLAHLDIRSNKYSSFSGWQTRKPEQISILYLHNKDLHKSDTARIYNHEKYPKIKEFIKENSYNL